MFAWVNVMRRGPMNNDVHGAIVRIPILGIQSRQGDGRFVKDH